MLNIGSLGDFFKNCVLLVPKKKSHFYSKRGWDGEKSSLKWLLVLWLPFEFFGKRLEKHHICISRINYIFQCCPYTCFCYFLFKWEATKIYTPCISVFLKCEILSSQTWSLLPFLTVWAVNLKEWVQAKTTDRTLSVSCALRRAAPLPRQSSSTMSSRAFSVCAPFTAFPLLERASQRPPTLSHGLPGVLILLKARGMVSLGSRPPLMTLVVIFHLKKLFPFSDPWQIVQGET